MNRLTAAGCVLALGLLPAFAQDKKDKDKPNPAATKIALDKHARHKTFLKRNEERKHKGDVIFLGDSITEGWEKNGTKAWKDSFGEFEPVNLGISGDVTGGVLWRISDGKEIEKLKPKAAVIMIGTNNLSRNHTPEQIAGGIKAIIDELKTQKPEIKVLLLGVFPRGNRGDFSKDSKIIPGPKLNKKVGEINTLLAKFDDGKTVFFKDIGKDFLDKDGGLSAEIMPDALHLSPKGYEIWGKAIKDDLAKLAK